VSSLYVETSAVLTWLLGETRADEVRVTVDSAEVVVTSSLTFTETERAVVRAESERLIRAADGQRLRGLLRRASSGWMRMTVSEDVLARAGRPFPVEPVRTLDAIHLATALAFTRAFSDLRLLSFDRRLLENARALGID
jgi:predicted nucleic acid-binding protein